MNFSKPPLVIPKASAEQFAHDRNDYRLFIEHQPEAVETDWSAWDEEIEKADGVWRAD